MRRKNFLETQPKTRSAVARLAWERSGAGTHGKGKRAARRADRHDAKRALRRDAT